MSRLSICFVSFLLIISTCFLAAFGCAGNNDSSSGSSSGISDSSTDSSGGSSSGGSSSTGGSSSGGSSEENHDEKVLLNQDLYLALSGDINDETTSVLYSVDGGPFRCDYMYVPDETKRKGFNAIEFKFEVKTGGGYLFVVEGGNTNISTAWGADGAYSVAAAIGKDYYGKVTPYSDASYSFANENVLQIYKGKVARGENLSGKPIDFKAGDVYTVKYRLPEGHALSFFYTKTLYGENGSQICWAKWNSNEYCQDVLNSLKIYDFYGINMEGEYIMAREDHFTVNGYNATVLVPENANGEWLWKTEFFYAFDKSERALYDEGYTRVYYEISDKYGSPSAVKLMADFYAELMKKYGFLQPKGHLLGFSRGGLYAFNFTMAHPECVKSLYLDAPVLDLRSWPRTDPQYNEVYLHEQVMREYGFSSEEEFLNYDKYPVGRFQEYFALGIPTLLISGVADRTVAFADNSAHMIDYCVKNGVPLTFYAKLGADHHPHSFGNVGGVDMYGDPYPETFRVYSSEYAGSSYETPVEIKSDENIVVEYFKNLDKKLNAENQEKKTYAKAVFYGDSITYGVYTREGDPCPMQMASPCYAELVAAGLKTKAFVNHGISGISYSSASSVLPESALCKTVSGFDIGDAVFIAAGTNDYGTDVPLGKNFDTGENTFYGAVYNVLKEVKNRAPRADVFVILPIPRKGESVKNKAGYALEDYRTALRIVAARMGVNVIDGSKLGINPESEADAKKYIFDGTHINTAGHKMYADLILSAIEN